MTRPRYRAIALASLWTVSARAFVAPSAFSEMSSPSTVSCATRATSTQAERVAQAAEPVEPQGTYHGWYSPKPLTDALEWLSSPGTYFKRLSDELDGETVFKAHPGLKCIALLDHTSGRWFFSQPESILDRQDGPRFGPLKCTDEYVGKSLPALVTNMPEQHQAVRDYTLSIFRERLGSVQSAWEHSSANFYDDLFTNGLGDYPSVYDTFLKQTYAFMLEWFLATGEEGGQSLPPFEDFRRVNPIDISVLLSLEVDVPLANLAAKVGQAVAGVSKEEVASVDVLLKSIQSSRLYPKYVEMMKDQKVRIDDLDHMFMFNTGFQSSSALAKQMEYAVGTLTLNPDFLEELRKELDGKELTVKNVNSAKDFPLLDSFHWEILRVFPAPPFFFKTAKQDLVVPSSNGKSYQIRKGDMLCTHHPLVHIDEKAFGPDAKEFKPKRFIDNPELKKDVFAYAFPNPSEADMGPGKPWGCGAHTVGMLDATLKLFYSRWVQEAEWEMADTPILDRVKYLGVVGPSGFKFSNVRRRQG